MPPDYIQLPPNNAPTTLNQKRPIGGGNDMGVFLSKLVLAQMIAQREQFL